MDQPELPDEAAPASRGGGPGPAALSGLAWTWTRAVAAVTFIPGPRARARTTLEGMLRRLVRALRTEPFDAAAGYRVGTDLVAARMSAPAVLGESIALLGQRLLPAMGAAGEPAAARRLTVLLGQLAAGFTEALRGVAVGAAEEISRAERVAWRREQDALRRRLQYALLHDPVTGLPNRATLLESLAAQVTDRTPDDRLGLGLIFLDRLATVTATFGHDTTERLLSRVARHLRPLAARRGYLLAQPSTDEFVLVLPDCGGAEEVIKVVDQVLRAFPELLTVDGQRLPVVAKAGIVECVAAGASPIELLRRAHAALGWAMTDQHSQYALFDRDRRAADDHRRELAVRMPAAVQAGEFVLDYQPLLRLADGGVVGAEALVRWHHPELGVLAPGRFIPLAEETGLIVPLGLRLLEQACVEAVGWRTSPGTPTGGGEPSPPFVSVNLAPAQLAHPGLVAAVAAVLDRSGLDPARLQLEITESAAVDAHRHDVLDRLADLGISLAIDDFGTGYSSLAYLTELPVRTVKLAARFVAPGRAGRPGRPATILPNVIAMCHELGISVTAEGVETAEQAATLAALRCDTGQGYYLARPTTPAGIAATFAAPPHPPH